MTSDKDSDSKSKHFALRRRGIRPQLPKRVWKREKNLGSPIKILVPRFPQEPCVAWFQKNVAGLLFNRSEFTPVSTLSFL